MSDNRVIRINKVLRELNISLDKSIVEDLDFFKDKWGHYNPHTPHIRREGLCVLNERGKVGYKPFKEPSLDSLRRFNNLNGTTWKESDFKKPTELYHHSSALQKLFKDILPHCQRTHFFLSHDHEHPLYHCFLHLYRQL